MFNRYFNRLIAVVFAAIVLCGCYPNSVNRADDDGNAINKLRELGATVEINPDSLRVEMIDVSEMDNVDDSTFRLMQSFSELKKIYAIYTSVGKEGLKHLKDKSKLEVLHLYACQNVDDESISMFSNHACLRDVNLVGTKITDKCARTIASWASLKMLEVDTISKEELLYIKKALPDCEVE